MTNELIKVLMLFALYGALEIALFSSSIGRLVSRAVRSPRPSMRKRATHPSRET
ncbi:hypothetical protein M2427_000360 [Bradyrhizobium sp. BR13661]|jgi:hypothetical protein|nr:hypothetical protein [Bradyrhizobium sp. BR13661]